MAPVNLLESRRRILLNTPHIVTPAPAKLQTFTTDMTAPLKECTIHFSATQEGTGEPAPDNVRAIVGRTGLQVLRTGSNLFPEAIFSIDWTTEAGTVYGGTVDLVSGVLTATHGKMTVDGVNTPFVAKGSASNFYVSIYPGYRFDRTGASWVWADEYLEEGFLNNLGSYPVDRTEAEAGLPAFAVYVTAAGTLQPRLWFADSMGIDTLQKANAWVAEKGPWEFVYKLATPVTYQITPQTLKTLNGTNNLWSNANGDIDLKYWRH